MDGIGRCMGFSNWILGTWIGKSWRLEIEERTMGYARKNIISFVDWTGTIDVGGRSGSQEGQLYVPYLPGFDMLTLERILAFEEDFFQRVWTNPTASGF